MSATRWGEPVLQCVVCAREHWCVSFQSRLGEAAEAEKATAAEAAQADMQTPLQWLRVKGIL